MAMIVKGGKVWNGAAFEERDLFVEGRYLTDAAAEGCEVVDAAGKYIVPGIINTSVNMTARSTGDYAHVFLGLSPEQATVTAMVSMGEHLRNGVTTVRDCGCRHNESLVLRDAVERGDIVGPSIVACGKMVLTPGSHWAGEFVTGAIEARKAAANIWAGGADFFKLGVSGGIGGDREIPDSLELGLDEVKAFCDFGNDHKMKVVCHTHGARSMRVALEAGAYALMHCTFIEDDIIEKIVEKGVYVTPTLAAYEGMAIFGLECGWNPKTVAMIRDEVLPAKRKGIRKLVAAGAKIAFGTMAGGFHITPFDNMREFHHMQEMGMSNAQIIQSTSQIAAEVCCLQDRVGALETGKWADFLLLDENPLDNIEAYGKISKVFKFGKEVYSV